MVNFKFCCSHQVKLHLRSQIFEVLAACKGKRLKSKQTYECKFNISCSHLLDAAVFVEHCFWPDHSMMLHRKADFSLTTLHSLLAGLCCGWGWLLALGHPPWKLLGLLLVAHPRPIGIHKSLEIHRLTGPE